MDAAGPGRFAQSVIGVVLHFGEIPFPVFYQSGRHRLRPDMHQPPAGQVIIRQFQFAFIQRYQDILRPRHQKPDNRPSFFVYRLQDVFRTDFRQNRGAAPRQQAPQPVHLGACMVKRRYQDKVIFMRLVMVLLLQHCRKLHICVGQNNRLWFAGSTGGKIQPAGICRRDFYFRRLRRCLPDNIFQ